MFSLNMNYIKYAVYFSFFVLTFAFYEFGKKDAF
ncbi:MAG: hypothetical protein JG782_1985 [Anaerophaga sp.]|nr:hypothetical protein [Anaerophaga sp.]MDI3521788.1 hypothetical protein [Anaerophaga sp.]MDK2843083.1 hypothetical protein [Anaerophaga sp.]